MFVLETFGFSMLCLWLLVEAGVLKISINGILFLLCLLISSIQNILIDLTETMKTINQYAHLTRLNPCDMNQRLKNMVLGKWFVSKQGVVGLTMHILLCDQKGNRCEAIVDECLIENFVDKIVVGSVYVIAGFSVVDRIHIFPPSDNLFMIMFHHTTNVIPTYDAIFPRSLFHFTSFFGVKCGPQDEDVVLYDVIGAVVDFQEQSLNDEGVSSMLLLLQDADGTEIQCLLKDSYCRQFKSSVDSNFGKNGPFVMILQMCGVEYWNGEVVLCTSENATNLNVDQECDEIINFKKEFFLDIPPNSYNGSRLGVYAIDRMKDELLDPDVDVLSLGQLKSTCNRGEAWVIGSISNVLRFRGWYNTKCFVCKTEVTDAYSRVVCDVCHSYIARGGNLVS